MLLLSVAEARMEREGWVYILFSVRLLTLPDVPRSPAPTQHCTGSVVRRSLYSNGKPKAHSAIQCMSCHYTVPVDLSI